MPTSRISCDCLLSCAAELGGNGPSGYVGRAVIVATPQRGALSGSALRTTVEPVESWDEVDVGEWFHSIGEEDATEVVRSEKVTGETMMGLSQAALIEILKKVPAMENIRALVAHEGGSGVLPKQVRDSFCSPLTHHVMHFPVVAADRITYERQAIEEWLRTQDKSRRCRTSFSLQTRFCTT